MNSKTINKDGYNIHVIKTDRFKSNEMDIVFSCENTKENYLLSALIELLYLTSEKYKTKRDRYIRCEELYSEEFELSADKIGTMTTFSIAVNFINPKLVKDDYAKEAIEFPFDIFNNPIFDESKLDEIKDKMKYKLKKRNERPQSLAAKNAHDLFFEGSIYNNVFLVEEDIIDTITIEQIKNRYNDLVNNSNVDVFLVGDIDDKYIDYIDQNMKYKSVNKEFYEPIRISSVDEIKEKTDIKEDINQAQMIYYYDLPVLNNKERCTLKILNNILGNGMSSRLFNIVREKHHLCYSIYSHINIYEGSIHIYAGVDDKNIKKTNKLIDEVFDSMKSITDEEVNDARTRLLNGIRAINNSIYSIYDRLFDETLLKKMSIEEEIEYVNSVTKEDIYKLLDSIKINTKYVLKGE